MTSTSSHRRTLAELAKVLGARLQGDPDYVIEGLADIEHAQAEHLSFIAGKAYAKYLQVSQAGALLLRADMADKFDGNCLVVDDPYFAFARISGWFATRPQPIAGIHSTAVVAEDAQVDPTAAIGPHCVIESGAVIGAHTQLVAGVFVGARTRIGSNCLLHANVSLYHDVYLGDRVTIHSATVVGSDGFGFAPTAAGWEKIHQLGGVRIGDDVEIGSGTTIDRGALNDTVIGRNVIIDNQVHLAHNVKIGDFTAIAGCCGIAGSTEVGAHCLLGGSVNIGGHLKIADHVQFNGAAVVTKSIHEPGVYASGTPIQPVKQWRKNAVRFGQLDKLFDRVKQIEGGENSASTDNDE